MWRTRIVKCGVVIVASAACLFAQSSETNSTPPSGVEPAPAPTVRAQRRTPRVLCWRQAGIAPSMVNERWKIEDRGKVKIAGVCQDPSLSAEQRRDKIRQINADTDAEVAGLIPAKQLEEFKACQAEQDKNRPKPAGEKELGPCGGIIPPPPPAAGAHSH